jgi:rhodanese-related sulfurtransferase
MPSPTEITVQALARRMGLPDAPAIADVCTDEDYTTHGVYIPGAERRSWSEPEYWAHQYKGRSVVVYCQKGKKISQGVAAWLRHAGIEAETLEGGIVAWREAKLPLVRVAALPPRDAQGRTVWVTRQRPKVDRIACPWLIRRFIDPKAVFLFVTAAEVPAVAERFNATPFDIDGVHWSHRGDLCTFDVMIEEFGLAHAPLMQLATIVRGADTARPDLAPEVAGFLAASLGLSRVYKDDLAQLDAGMTLYDAFYRWCRDATGEAHNWPSPAAGLRS